MRPSLAPWLTLVPAMFLALTRPAAADLKIRLPHVEFGELEIEHNGFISFGPKGSPSDRARSYSNSIGYGVTEWWKIELEGEMEAGPGRPLKWTATTIENTFQLTEPGKYMFDVGLFFEYSRPAASNAGSIQFGPVLHKEVPDIFGIDTAHTLNLSVSREIGGNASRETGLNLAWQSVARLHPLFAPGVEYFAEIADVAHSGSYNQQQHFAGPVITGAKSFAPYGKLKYEIGYLFGLTTATPKSALRWRLEYEIAF